MRPVLEYYFNGDEPDKSTPSKKLMSMLDTLTKYYETGKKSSFVMPVLTDSRERWFFEQMLLIVHDLHKNGMDTMDIHPGNLGFKSNGNLAMFDLGAGRGMRYDYGDETELDVETYGFKTILGIIKKRLEIKNTRFLGGGAYGRAYDIGNNRVLKISTDSNEAMNSKRLIGKKNGHLSNIYDVKGFRTKNGRSYYAIILEKLDQSKRVDNIYHQLQRNIYRQMKNISTKHIRPRQLLSIKDDFIRTFLITMTKEGYQYTWNKYFNDVKEFEKEHGDMYNFNDISEISEWVFDSITNDNYNENDPPEYIMDLFNKLKA